MTGPGAGSASPAAAQRFDLAATGGRAIRGEARVVPDAAGSVVLVHGFKGFARFAFFPYLAERLAAAGLTAVTFNMSGSGIGEDLETFTEPQAFAENTYTRELQDLALVLAESRRRGWTGAQFGLFGHSRGGGVALLEAARDARVRALATWASIATVLRWSDDEVARWRERGHLDVPNSRTGQVLPLSTALLDETMEHHLGRLSLRRAAATLLCPWLIVHGDADETVPFDEAEQLFAASEGRAELLRIAGGTHTFNVAHGMTTPSPQLAEAVERTARFFVDRLVARA
jgi:alpha-beta hydrolase superfamily lysophospholipase